MIGLCRFVANIHAMTQPAGIRIEGLCKTYRTRKRSVEAVRDVNLCVESGEVFGLLGPNGAGKTTTIRMITGLLSPTSGSVEVDGIRVADEPELARMRIGLVPEDAGHLKNLTLREELRFYGAMYGLSGAEADRRAQPIAERLEIADRFTHRVKTFSRGMRRKTHLIRAMLHDPSVLLLDEPTAGLDPSVTVEVWNLLEDLAKSGKTIVFCSHHLEEVERLCKRVAIIRGSVLAMGEPHSLVADHTRLEIRLAGDSAGNGVTGGYSFDGMDGLGDVSKVDHVLEMELLGEPDEIVPRVVASLVGQGARVVGVAVRRSDLRSIYRSVVGADPEEPTSGANGDGGVR